ncbi:MAG: nuclear transport factor 2 family protein [Pseudomonadota bacterium]
MDAASLLNAHHQRLDALMRADTEALAQVVGEDMVFVGPDGGEITRPEVVASLKAGDLRIEKMDCFDISTRLYGEVGILAYSADARTSDGTHTYEGQVRCTTVYVWRDEGWQMVSQHQSRMG